MHALHMHALRVCTCVRQQLASSHWEHTYLLLLTTYYLPNTYYPPPATCYALPAT